jgi:colanic acid biosynthesis glycosyl transferase WcaI
LRKGLGAVSVPSKTYSILAAGRPVVAAIDEGTEVPRILAASGAGVSVPPDDIETFVGALRDLIGDSSRREILGRNARDWVVSHVSPDAVAEAYLSLVDSGR